MPRRPTLKDTPNVPERNGDSALFLREVAIRKAGDPSRFPFSVPAIRTLQPLILTSPVTFFVGENGSGKSTLMEAIATVAHLPAVGSVRDIHKDDSLEEQKWLGRALRLTWNHRTARGFFLRAEDFFGFAKQQAALRAELLGRIDDLEVEYADRSAWAKGLAMGPAKASLAEMERLYGVDIDANSHGQSFLRLFRSRFIPRGLFLLDEPEAALSPQSQLALLVMIQEMVDQEAQFIIATHSPIILAYPGATIYSFDSTPVSAVMFDELEHVTLTRDFLNAPERYLRALRRKD